MTSVNRIKVADEEGYISAELANLLETIGKLRSFPTATIQDKASICNQKRFDMEIIKDTDTNKFYISDGNSTTSGWGEISIVSTITPS